MSATRALPLFLTLLVATAHADESAHKPSSYDVQRMIETVAVASPYRMSTSARDGTIRYRIALADGDGTRWVSYDAGLGRFDAGHIALVVGDGTPPQAD